MRVLFCFFEYGAMKMNLHRSCEQVIQAWSRKEATGSWDLTMNVTNETNS